MCASIALFVVHKCVLSSQVKYIELHLVPGMYFDFIRLCVAGWNFSTPLQNARRLCVEIDAPPVNERGKA